MKIANTAIAIGQYFLTNNPQVPHTSRLFSAGVMTCCDDSTREISASRAPEKNRNGLMNSPLLKK